MYTKHEWKSDKYLNLKYVQYLPKDYDENKQYPLVFFLHGAGERGDDLDHACVHGYMKYVRKEGKEYPFIFAAPQCPEGTSWRALVDDLLALLDHICSTLPVDKKKVYLTGLSMGGGGTWRAAIAAPEKFAAIVPVCAGSVSEGIEALKDIPIYIYHGEIDDVIPASESVKMYEELKKLGADVQLKICEGIGHNAWDVAYTEDALIDWMLSKSK